MSFYFELTDECCSVTISAHWVLSVCFLRFDPDVLLSVEHSQARVVLLTIVATEDVQLTFVQSRSMILNLGCLADDRSQ